MPFFVRIAQTEMIDPLGLAIVANVSEDVHGPYYSLKEVYETLRYVPKRVVWPATAVLECERFVGFQTTYGVCPSGLSCEAKRVVSVGHFRDKYEAVGPKDTRKT